MRASVSSDRRAQRMGSSPHACGRPYPGSGGNCGGPEGAVALGSQIVGGNRHYRRYLSTSERDSFHVVEAKIVEDVRYDGTWVLRTNTELDAAEVALQYKRLWMVEQWLRSSKSLIHLPPARYAEARLTHFVAMQLLTSGQHFPFACAAPQPHSSILS